MRGLEYRIKNPEIDLTMKEFHKCSSSIQLEEDGYLINGTHLIHLM